MPVGEGANGRDGQTNVAVAIPGLYAGTSMALVDGKGRLAIPAHLRNAIPLTAENDRQLTVHKHDTLDCLVAFDPERLKARLAEIERDEEIAIRRGQEFDREGRARAVYSTAETYTLDNSGRFILSPMLRMLGKIDGQVILAGAGQQFEIWTPQSLLDSSAANEALKTVARMMLDGGK